MDNVVSLQKKLIEKDKFIKEILLEMREIYELFDGLKDHAEVIQIELKLLVKEMERNR